MEAFGGTPPNSGLLPLAYAASARAHIQAGDFDRAGALLDRALARPAGNAVADEVRHPGIAAFVAATAGELSRAERLVAKCVQSADQLGLDRHEPGTIFAGLALVEVHLERHEHDAARRTLDEVTPASEASHRLTLQSLVTLQHAKLARALGDAAGADALLAQARLFYVDPDDAVRQVFGEEAVAQALRFDPDKAPSLIADLDDQRVETRVLSARAWPSCRTMVVPPNCCWATYRRRPPDGLGWSAACCAPSACCTAMSSRPTAISPKRCSPASRSG